METKVESLEDNRAKITVTVEASEIDARINRAYKEVAKKNSFPGFRKGKAPRAVIDAAFGAGYIAATVTEDVVNDMMPLAIDGADLFPVGQAQFDEIASVVAGEDFTFSFSIGLRTEIELSSYEPVAIEMPAAEVTDAEIDMQYDAIIDQYAQFEVAAEGAKAAEGDRLVMAMQAADDKAEKIDQLTSDEFQYTIGSGLMPAEFDEKLVGAAAGDKLEFSVPVAEGTAAYLKELVGKTESVSFTVEVKELKTKVAPTVDDAWVADNFGFETVAELRERISESLTQQKADFLPRLKEDRVLYALLERVTDEAPEAMVEEQEQDLLQEFFQQLQRSGQTYDAYLKANNLTAAQVKDDIKQQAAEVVKQNLALDAWARHFEIACEDADVQAEFIKANADEWESLYNSWKQAGRLHLVREGVLRSKAMNAAVEGAVVTEIPFGETADAE